MICKSYCEITSNTITTTAAIAATAATATTTITTFTTTTATMTKSIVTTTFLLNYAVSREGGKMHNYRNWLIVVIFCFPFQLSPLYYL